MRLTIVSYLTAIMALAMSVCACNDDEEFTTDPAATISFSRDPVSFDTIFTKSDFASTTAGARACGWLQWLSPQAARLDS